MSEKPRILVLDDLKVHTDFPRIADLLEIHAVESWERFDEILKDPSPFALAILRPLMKTPERKRRMSLQAAGELKAVFGGKPILTHCNLENLHNDLFRAGYSHVVRNTKEIEPLVASLLHLTIPAAPTTAPLGSRALSTGFAENLRPKAPPTKPPPPAPAKKK